jgi:hypothetical protein
VSFPNLPVSSADHVAVTCHYIDDECNLVEALLDFSKVDGEHSGFNLAAKLMGILEEYDICQNRGSGYGLPDVDRVSGRGYRY